MSDLAWSATGLVDVVIGVTLLEAAGLFLLHRFTGKGIAPGALFPNLTAGLCLVLALRSYMGGAAWTVTAAWLAVSGLAHATDLWRRWRR